MEISPVWMDCLMYLTILLDSNRFCPIHIENLVDVTATPPVGEHYALLLYAQCERDPLINKVTFRLIRHVKR